LTLLFLRLAARVLRASARISQFVGALRAITLQVFACARPRCGRLLRCRLLRRRALLRSLRWILRKRESRG
jgi:hypothetical protein